MVLKKLFVFFRICISRAGSLCGGGECFFSN
jgi:hypothetical protein